MGSADPLGGEERPAEGGLCRGAGGVPRTVRELVFDRLPAAVRDRLAQSVGPGIPAPLLAAPSGRAPLVRRLLIGVALAAAAATIVLAFEGFGDVGAPRALEPPSFAAAYGALFFIAVVAGAAAVEVRRLARGVPFRSGRYLFALDLVEVSGGRLRVTSLDTLRDVEPHGSSVALRFEDGHDVLLPLSRGDDPGLVLGRIRSAVETARKLSCPADAAALERLDPLFELRLANDWAAAAAGERVRSRLPWVAAGAALAAAPAGHYLLQTRNALSDDMMFEEATTRQDGELQTSRLFAYARVGRRHDLEAAHILVDQVKLDPAALRRYVSVRGTVGVVAQQAFLESAADDPDALSWYLGRGGDRADEVDDALFALARRRGTLEAYGTYLEHGKRHADEVRQRLLPDADFAQASRSPLVGSLLSFVRRYPGGEHEDEAWKLIRGAYARALPALTAAEHPPADGLRFAEALLASLEDRADPRLDLEIRMTPPTSVAAADAVLREKYGARYLAGASRFSEAALDDLSENIRVAVGGWFGRAFPGGVAETTRPSSDAEGRPRIEIRCEPVARGAAHWRAPGAASDDGEVVTPEVAFVVEVRGTAPGREREDATLAWELRVEDTSEGKMQTTDFRGAGRDPREMVEDAFAHLLEAVPERIAASFHEKL